MKRPFLGIFAMRLTIYEGLEARGSNRWPCLKVPAAQADKVAARHCPLVVGQSAGDGHLPETAESSMISNHFQSFPITFYKIMKRLFWDFRYAIDDLRGFGGAGVKPVAMPQSAGCAGRQGHSATLSTCRGSKCWGWPSAGNSGIFDELRSFPTISNHFL